MDDCADNKRKARNLNEKKRRDQFNSLVNELGSLIDSANHNAITGTVCSSCGFDSINSQVTQKRSSKNKNGISELLINKKREYYI